MASMEAYLQRAEQIRRLTTNRLLSGEGVGGVADVLQQLTNRPVMILSLSDGSTTSAPPGFQPPIPLDRANLPRLPARSYAVQVPGEVLGHLLFWGDDPVDRVVVEHGITAAAIAIRQRQELLEFSRRFQDELLAALIGQGPGLYTSLRARAADLGHVLCDHYVAACLGQEDHTPDSALFRSTAPAKTGLLSNISRWLPPGSLWGVDRDERLVLLLPGDVPDGDAGDPETGARRLLQDLLTRIRDLTELRWTGGMGRLHAGLEGVPRSYQEAITALRVAQAVAGGGQVLPFRELGLFRLVHQDPFAAEEFVSDTIRPVLVYDRERRTSLVATLQTFLETGGNFRETAKRLFVHHNTVRHRIGLVTRLTGLDLSDSDQRLNLQVGLKLFPLLSAANRNGCLS